jgi:hypothetical protein
MRASGLADEILDRFHVQHDAWLATVETFDATFGHAVGRAETMAAVVERMEREPLKGIAACRAAFA